MRNLTITVCLLGLVFSAPLWADEHPGEEHAGQPAPEKEETKKQKAAEEKSKEHPGEDTDKKKKKEHPGEESEEEEHPGEQSKNFNAAQIKTAMNKHIQGETKDGVFAIVDPKTGQNLQLKFVKIHDPVRKIGGKGYFACTDFEVAGQPGKLYDLDFWLNPKGGRLAVTDTKIHKEPRQAGGAWTKHARYTFIKDQPVEIR